MLSWHIVGVENGVVGEFRFFGSPNLLVRCAFGKSHVFVRLVNIKAKKFFFVIADVIFRKDVNDVTLRTKIDALHDMVETISDWIPRFETSVGGGGQVITGCFRVTGNQKKKRQV